MDTSLSLTSLSPEMLVRLLKRSGSAVISIEMLESDVESGAPRNLDGTFNLINYAAYLAKDISDDASD